MKKKINKERCENCDRDDLKTEGIYVLESPRRLDVWFCGKCASLAYKCLLKNGLVKRKN